MRRRLVFLVASFLLYSLINAPFAEATIDTTATALEVANAIAQNPSQVTGAAFEELPPSGTPKAMSDTALAAFPRDGADYGILTTGDANFADDANTAEDTGVDDGGGNIRGDADFDVTVLRIDLNAGIHANCLTVEFRFFSEEFDEFVGSDYSDVFIAELDATTWSTEGTDIDAQDNFAFDPEESAIGINATGATSLTAAEAEGTTYDGGTPILAASMPIEEPGAHSLYLSIFDHGDSSYDSAVFLDNLTLSTAAEDACISGAFPHQPDGQIKQGRGGYVGKDVYNSSGQKQTITETVQHGNQKTFDVRIQNDGLQSDSFTVSGCHSTPRFTITYKQGTVITPEVVAGTYLIGPLDPALTTTIYVTIHVKASGEGKTKSCKVTTTSQADTTRSDSVVAKVKGT